MARGKMPLILVLVVLLVAAGGLYSAYAFFDVFKSDKTVYLEAEAKEMQNFSEMIEEYNQKYNEYAKPYLEGAVEQKIELSNLTVDMQTTDPQEAKIMEIVKDAKVVVESKMDDKNKKNFLKADVNIKNNNVIGVEFFYDAEKLGFGVPALYNKYGYFNWKDKAVIEQKYGIPGIPESIPSQKEYLDLIQIPKEELQPIMREYAMLYADSIQNDQVSVKKNATFEEAGVKMDAKEITVTFTPEQYKQLMKKMADKISKDQKLQDLLYPRYQKLAELTASGSPEDLPKLSKEEFKKKFAEFKEEADRSIDNGEYGDGIKMIVYADKEDNILSRTIEMNDTKSGDKNTLKLVSFQDKENKDHVVFDVNTKKSDNMEEKVNIAYVNKKEGENCKGNVKFTVVDKTGSSTLTDVVAEADFAMTKEGNKQNQDVKVKINDNESGQSEPIVLSWKGTVTNNDKDKTRIADYKVEMSGPQDDPTMPKKISLDMKSNEKFNVAGVKLPELNAQNSINLATMTDQQMMQIQQEIQQGSMQFMMKNMALFQQLGIIPADAGMMMP
ncbi:DUF6583 family protein [Aneurinibacillus danicus]|jgi:hypothetical protein|uniref:Uncharacterized protein n=1 Tax=Aneurinibacillus danicus TaxID=267746 RepID=A0A511VDK9_9BACL|nr:DUF6583 family protein [Aneurinibacillus danicus]GEN35673.1 hypothetical protein ADA01nite_31330 [Aneurinibacillus danicus]